MLIAPLPASVKRRRRRSNDIKYLQRRCRFGVGRCVKSARNGRSISAVPHAARVLGEVRHRRADFLAALLVTLSLFSALLALDRQLLLLARCERLLDLSVVAQVDDA